MKNSYLNSVIMFSFLFMQDQNLIISAKKKETFPIGKSLLNFMQNNDYSASA